MPAIMTTLQEFQDIPTDPDKVIAILPLAATEQHGPHLPNSTDTNIMNGMLELAIKHIPDECDIHILPVEDVGLSIEHSSFKGTQTYQVEELYARWCMILESLFRIGVKKCVLINSHGGNEPLMALVALHARVHYAMMVVKTSWERFGMPEGLIDDNERKIGIHGGEYETSLMLYFFPQLVDMDKAKNFSSKTIKARKTFKHLAPQSPHGFAWMAQDLNTNGVTGNAEAATLEKGKRIAHHQVNGFVELLHDVCSAKIDEWLKI